MRRLLRLYRNAPEWAIVEGALWYANAAHKLREIAERRDFPFPIVAAVCAALSPRCPWEKNLSDVEEILYAARHIAGVNSATVTTYHANRWKAYSIAVDLDVSFLSGSKVTAFYRNLMGDYDALTLDTHAINAWRGKRTPRATRPEMRQAREDYHRAAARLRVPVAIFQAVVWVLERSK